MKPYLSFFSAAYRDGRVIIGEKRYAAGLFTVHLLNQYYKNDTAARLAVYKMNNWNVTEQIRNGYVVSDTYLAAGNEIRMILKTLPKLHPFDLLDIETETKRIGELFSETQAERITEYFRRRAAVSLRDENNLAIVMLSPAYNKDLFDAGEALVSEVLNTLSFYDSISMDMQNAFHLLTEFAGRVDEAERFDEAHLLPIAEELFSDRPFSVGTEYVPIRKNRASKDSTLARKLTFESYYGFILTDFFEGLHYGHYPRQCAICGKYFLMQSARRQKYCNGYSDIHMNGKRLTCRKAGALRQNTEKAADHPYNAIYKSRCGGIRVDKSRGNITPEFAVAALSLAKDYLALAKQNPGYAKQQYIADMQKDALYTETAKRLNTR